MGAQLKGVEEAVKAFRLFEDLARQGLGEREFHDANEKAKAYDKL
mgnify:CR=1 FL=1